MARFRERPIIRAVPLAVAAAVTVAVYAHDLTRWPIWYDEGFTSLLLRDGFGDIVERTVDDVHPPLYYLVLDAWATAFGRDLGALRAFSAVCMVVSALLAAHLVRRLGLVSSPLATGLVAAAAGLAPAAVLYAQEARMYGFGSVLVGSSTLSLLRLREHPTRWRAVGYGITVAACAYTHYFSLGFLLVHGWWIWAEGRSSVNSGVLRTRFLQSGTVAAVLFVPWLPRLAEQLEKVGGGFWIEDATWRTPIVVLYEVLAAETVLSSTWWMAGAVAAAGLVLVLGWLALDPAARRGLVLLAAPLPITVALLSVLSLDAVGFSSVLVPRYLALLAPPFFAALAAAALRRRAVDPVLGWAPVAVTVLLLFHGTSSAISGTSREFRADVRTVAAYVDGRADDGDLIVVDRYFHAMGIAHHLGDDPRLRILDDGDQFGGAAVLEGRGLLVTPSELAGTRKRIWLVRDHPPLAAYRDRLAEVVGGRRARSTMRWPWLEVVELDPLSARSAPTGSLVAAPDGP